MTNIHETSLAPLQEDTGGGGFCSERAHQAQLELGWVEVLEVRHRGSPDIPVLVPRGEPVLTFDDPQRVVVWADVVRKTERLPDDRTLQGQGGKAVPERHHPDHGRVHVLNEQQLS